MWWQISILIIAFLTLLGSIISVYVSMRIAVAKIEVELKSIERDMIAKELAICNIEKFNREDHIRIIDKIDKISDYVKK